MPWKIEKILSDIKGTGRAVKKTLKFGAEGVPATLILYSFLGSNEESTPVLAFILISYIFIFAAFQRIIYNSVKDRYYEENPTESKQKGDEE